MCCRPLLCRLEPGECGALRQTSDWPWSSYAAMAGLAPVPRFLTTEWVLGLFGIDERLARRRLRAFVEDAEPC